MFPNRTLINNFNLASFILLVCSIKLTEKTYAAPLTNQSVETGQQLCFNATEAVDCQNSGQYFGQDAQFTSNRQSYTSYSNDTITDKVTGIMWIKSPDTNRNGRINKADKLSSTDAIHYCKSLEFSGYADWQLPTIKQIYSLINFQGTDTDPMAKNTSVLTPFVDTQIFDFAYGNPTDLERVIDSQYATTNKYINDEGTKMLFGVNLADGRIKGYEEDFFGRDKTYFVQCMRGNTAYGTPQYVDNGDKTITDLQSGLMWSQNDSGAYHAKGLDYSQAFDWKQANKEDFNPLKDGENKYGAMNWLEALAYVQKMNDANYLGYNDWRLPDVKELVSIVNYDYSPTKTGTPAIDPIFNMTTIVNENGDDDWGFYWSNTTHKAFDKQGNLKVNYASYVAFGRSMGYSSDKHHKWVDVHGAGSQRSDPKIWDGTDYTHGQGPQADAIRIYNYVRLVRSPKE